MGAMFYNHAGDLHSPIGIHLTPLSGRLAIHNSHSPLYTPSVFIHRDSGYSAIEDTLDEFLNDIYIETVSNLATSTEFSA
ncbi:hypothetical protein N7497_012302 [Penicillium chrysogenum]|nr:hypothetical protein N7497_012302 [Penicillium chrysogenum]